MGWKKRLFGLVFLWAGLGGSAVCGEPPWAGDLVEAAGLLYQAKGDLLKAKGALESEDPFAAEDAVKAALEETHQAESLLQSLSGGVAPPRGFPPFPEDLPEKIRLGLAGRAWSREGSGGIVVAKVRVEDLVDKGKEHIHNAEEWAFPGSRERVGSLRRLGRASLVESRFLDAVEKYFYFSCVVREVYHGKILAPGKEVYGALFVPVFVRPVPEVRPGKDYWILGEGPIYRHRIPFFYKGMETYVIQEISPPGKKGKSSLSGDGQLEVLKGKVDAFLKKLRALDFSKDQRKSAAGVAALSEETDRYVHALRKILEKRGLKFAGDLLPPEVPPSIRGFCLKNPFFREGRLALARVEILDSRPISLFLLLGRVYLSKGKILEEISLGGRGVERRGPGIKAGDTIEILYKVEKGGGPEPRKSRRYWIVLRPNTRIPLEPRDLPRGGAWVHPALKLEPA